VILKTSQKGHGHFRATRARARGFENGGALTSLKKRTVPTGDEFEDTAF
jgi:hypothetical protein